MAHTLTTHAGESHLHTTAVTDDAFVLDTLVFSASTLPVTGRSEDSLTEETAFFWFESTVVDGFRIQHLAT